MSNNPIIPSSPHRDIEGQCGVALEYNTAVLSNFEG